MSPRSRTRKPAKTKPRLRAPSAEKQPRRYTPPRTVVRIRPVWHRVVAAVILALGIALIVVNYIDYSNADLLPGGHQDGYFILGALLAVSSGWWFGLFDRTQ